MNLPGTSSEAAPVGSHLTAHSTIRDILRHPSFAGFARLILPWDYGAYDEDLPLTRIGTLLPSHTHVDPETVANALIRLIDDASGGKTVFYRFYTEQQTLQQPAMSHAGLLFFRGGPGRHLQLSRRVADSAMSDPSTKAFFTQT